MNNNVVKNTHETGRNIRRKSMLPQNLLNSAQFVWSAIYGYLLWLYLHFPKINIASSQIWFSFLCDLLCIYSDLDQSWIPLWMVDVPIYEKGLPRTIKENTIYLRTIYILIHICEIHVIFCHKYRKSRSKSHSFKSPPRKIEIMW